MKVLLQFFTIVTVCYVLHGAQAVATEKMVAQKQAYAEPKVCIRSLINNSGKDLVLVIRDGQTIPIKNEPGKNQLQNPLVIPMKEYVIEFRSSLLEIFEGSTRKAVMSFARRAVITYQKNSTGLGYVFDYPGGLNRVTSRFYPINNVQVQDTYYVDIVLDADFMDVVKDIVCMHNGNVIE